MCTKGKNALAIENTSANPHQPQESICVTLKRWVTTTILQIHQISIYVAQEWQTPCKANCSTTHPLLQHDCGMLANMTSDDAYDVHRQST